MLRARIWAHSPQRARDGHGEAVRGAERRAAFYSERDCRPPASRISPRSASAPWALGREEVARGRLVIILWMGNCGRVVRGEPVLAGGRRRERDGPAATAHRRESLGVSKRDSLPPACPLALYAKRARVVGARGAKRGVA